jgi:transposase
VIRARDLLVRLRTSAENAVRGLTKACGHRMPASSTKCFASAQPGGHATGTASGTWSGTPADRGDDPEGQLRSLLIECANHILRPHGRDSALRQWGLHLAARGAKQAKSKAVVAPARKLAVLLHHLWTTQEPYMPLYEAAA